MRKTVVVPIQQRALGEYRARIENLLSLSELILTAAEQGDWTLALERQRQRSAELHAFFPVGDVTIPQDVAELISSGIRAMLTIDARVTDLAYARRESVRREAGLAQKQGLAARAYLGQTNR